MDISLLIELVRSTTQTPSKLPRQAPCGKGTVLVEGKNFLGSEKLITVRADTSTQGFPEHTHDYIEIVYMKVIEILIFPLVVLVYLQRLS